MAIILALATFIFDVFLGRYRQVQAPRILRDIAVVVVYIITIFIVLSYEAPGVNLSSLLTTSAVLTAVIGFALQDLLSNIISGIALQIEHPFRVGDWVMFDKQEGQVLETNWRSTKIKTLHNDIVIIPNKVITGASVINFTDPTSVHRRKLLIGMRYEAPPNKVKASILRALRATEHVLDDPAPYVLLISYDDFSIGYRIHFFIDQFAIKDRIEDQVRTRLWYQFRRDGLSIPFPIRDINVRQISEEQERVEREEEVDRIVASLEKVPLLAPLSDDERRRLARGITPQYFAAGETVITQGQPGDSFYIIGSGEVEVQAAGKRVATLHADDFFGERSLMTGEARSATIVTCSDCEFYTIGKDLFGSIIKTNQLLIEQIVAQLEARQGQLEARRKEAQSELAVVAEAAPSESLVHRIRRFFNLS